MKKIFTCTVFLFFIVPAIVFGAKSLITKEIPKVMSKLFAYHIENKELSPTIVRRCIKIYIENFDPDKTYLLESEVYSYLNLSDKQALVIAKRMWSGDYGDFEQLDLIFQNSIARSRKLRTSYVSSNHFSLNRSSMVQMPSNYAQSHEELVSRMHGKMTKFLVYQQKRSFIDTDQRKKLALELMDKKLRRFENGYLALNVYDESLSLKQKEHLFSVRILKSFAKSLDAHTSFFSQEEASEMRLNLEKQFEGFGVVLAESIDGVVVAEIIPGSPAAKSGKIAVNDVLIEIDGQELQNTPFEEVLSLMKKRDDPTMTLGLERMHSAHNQLKKNFWRVTLTKAPITMDQDRLSYSYEPCGSGIIAKITLHSFYENGNGINAEQDMKRAISELKKHGKIVGLVLDLRENAGGFLSQAVKVAGLFVSSGVIVISKYGQKDVHYLRNLDPRSFYSGPMVVLTSKLSASAAEIVAQSLQDYGVALVVGDERTFGKGSIQLQTVTDPKADMFFKVTVGKYYTVSGRTTQVTGVIADINVPTKFAPFNVGEKFLEYPLKSDKVAPAYRDSLKDIDERIKGWFITNYLPHLQKKVTKYHSMLPHLKRNSRQRIARNPDYQAFLKNQENIRARLSGDMSKPVDLNLNFGSEDIQMIEATNILKDMIYLEVQTNSKALKQAG